MWESRRDFQALWEGRRAFHKASFPPPLVTGAELIEEFAFSLLHAPCGIGGADGGAHGLERDEAETGAKVLCRFGEAEQGFQWSLIATVDAAHAPFVVHLDIRLCTRTMKVQIRIEVLPMNCWMRSAWSARI